MKGAASERGVDSMAGMATSCGETCRCRICKGISFTLWDRVPELPRDVGRSASVGGSVRREPSRYSVLISPGRR